MNPTPSRLFHYDHSPFVTNPLIFITVYYHLLTTSSHCIKLKYIIYVPTLLKCPDMHFVYKNRIGLRSAVRLAVVSSLINIIFHTTNLFALMYPLDLPNHSPTVLHHSPRHPSLHKNHLTCFSLDNIVDTAKNPSVPGNGAASHAHPASTLMLCHF